MIFLTGPHGSGKTTGSKLLEQYGFKVIDLGPTLRRLHTESDSSLSFGEWCRAGEADQGANFTDNLLINEINKRFSAVGGSSSDFLDLLIVGSRSAEGIQYLRTRAKCETAYTDSIIFLDAPFEILLRNYSEREGSRYSRGTFQVILERDREMGLESIRSIANYVVRNDGSLELLAANLEALIFVTLKYRRRVVE
ncbi:MAG: AAA family ATPase [Patescibacteria group bacterium]